MNPTDDVIRRIWELLDRGETFCVATVLTSDDPSLEPGSRCIFCRDGTPEAGSKRLGEDLEIQEKAARALQERKKQIVEPRPGLRVFLDILSGQVELLICGAGHIAVPLARFAREVGFSVTVLDDRPDFANTDRFPGCAVIAEGFVPALRCMPLGPQHHVVVITRGHEHDTECLTEVLRKETAYVGLIGSRRRVRFVLEMLEQEGVPGDRLQQVFTPIGLPIGAESPAEIALCIAAELVCVRRKGPLQARALRDAV